jgi:hypothetical protein
MPQNTPYAGVASLLRSALRRGESPTVLEDGRQRRDFVHVHDVARANVLALGTDLPPRELTPVNICSGHPHTVGELAVELGRACDGPEPTVVGGARPADVRHAVGRRVPAERGVWPWHARAGNRLLAAVLRRQGLPVHDIAPVRAVRRQALLELGVLDRAFGYPLEMLIKAGRADWKVREFDVAYGRRAKGTKSKVSGSMRGTLRAVRDMTRVLTS